MSQGLVTFNPYQAPEYPTSELRLPADTEFLFNYDVVAGIGKISLPGICVLSGKKENLVFRTSRLRWCTPLIVIPRNIMSVLSLIWGLSYAVSQATAVPGLPTATFDSGKQIVVAGAMIAATLGLILLSILLRKTVEVNWYLSGIVARRQKIRLAVLLSLAIAAIIVIVHFGVGRESQLALVPSVIAFLALLRGVKGSQPLWVVGQFNEMLLVSGFSRAFASETLKLVSAWERRQCDVTAKTGIPDCSMSPESPESGPKDRF